MAQKGLIDKVHLKKDEGKRPADNWENIPGRGNRQGKNSKIEVRLALLMNHKVCVDKAK